MRILHRFGPFCEHLICIGLIGGCVSEELQREMHLKMSELYGLQAEYNRIKADSLSQSADFQTKLSDCYGQMATAMEGVLLSRQRLAQSIALVRVTESQEPLDPRMAFKCAPPPESRRFILPGGVPLEMVGIGSGSFVMGTPKPIDDLPFDHDVGHKVTLTDSFWIGRFELTQGQYEAIVGSPRYADDVRQSMRGARLPVFDLAWQEAKSLTERLNELLGDELPPGYHFDLPTEAQWEYACRAGTVESFNWGGNPRLTEFPSPDGGVVLRTVRMFCERDETWANRMWVPGVSSNVVHSVGSFPPNRWGLYDMHGNVDEWCLDWFGEYPLKNVVDPVGAAVGVRRVMRGGNFLGGVGYVRDMTSHGRGRAPKRWDNLNSPFRDSKDEAVRNRPASSLAGLRVVLTREMLPTDDTEDKGVYGVKIGFAGGEELNRRLERAYGKMLEEQDRLSVEYWKVRDEGVRAAWNTTKAQKDFQTRMEKVAEEIRRKAIEAEIASEKAENNAREAALWQSVAREALEVILPAVQAGVEAAANEVIGRQGGLSAATGGGDAGGFATIKGPSSLTYDSAHRNGQTARYSLYVGGRDVTDQTTWGTAGTSISVNGNGRAMAGNPPCGRGGSFKTGVRATYNGKSYTKNITILKR